MKLFTISEETINQVLAYLGTRPYTEVYKVVQKLLTEVKPLNPEPEAAAPEVQEEASQEVSN